MNQAQQIKQELNGEITVTLKYPTRLATGETLNKVTVRRPRVGDLRAVMHIANEAEQGLALVSRITGLIPEDLDMLDLKDLEAIQGTFRSEEDESFS
ncbi:phage tail assembly protein [Neisseriaceae bacterium B1]